MKVLLLLLCLLLCALNVATLVVDHLLPDLEQRWYWFSKIGGISNLSLIGFYGCLFWFLKGKQA